jgi:hypothetical protein
MFSDYPKISENVFMFNIDVVSGKLDESIADDRIGMTVVEIFMIFFSKIEKCRGLRLRHSGSTTSSPETKV